MRKTTTLLAAVASGLLLLGQNQAVASEEEIGTIASSSSRHRSMELDGESYRIAASLKVTSDSETIKDIYQLPSGQPVRFTWRQVGETRIISHIHVLDSLPQTGADEGTQAH